MRDVYTVVSDCTLPDNAPVVELLHNAACDLRAENSALRDLLKLAQDDRGETRRRGQALADASPRSTP